MELRKIVGHTYHTYDANPASDTSLDQGVKTRLLEYLLQVKGIYFIPDGTRAKIYRRLASDLHDAKNTSYGWGKEATVAQFGPFVPTIVFEEFYQELLAVWCVNY